MTPPRKSALLAFSISILLCVASPALGDPADREGESDPTAQQSGGPVKLTISATTGTSGSSASGTTPTSGSRSKYRPFSEVLKDASPIDGLVKLYRKDEKLYGEVTSSNLNRDLIVLISIARGMGERPLLGGMSWGDGDDWIWQFRKAGERIQIVRRNVRFTAKKGSPEARAVRLAYTDSVLFSLPIATLSPSGGYVVDLTSVFMSDLPRISRVLSGFAFSRDKSTWASVKGFEDNMEIQVAATYASSGTRQFDTVPDSRGVTINVHYSISRLPQTGYRPRLADDRVGHFLTVLKDFSKSSEEERFIRYINRWDLRKADPSAEVSPPKKPIIFWLEKTIPFDYRKPIREGILEWNKAFEKAGFANAIEVRQQPDDATWDPEDINYNTFRWITANAGFAMGPSRTNPTTGQILDADIIFDADFLDSWKSQFEVLTPETRNTVAGRPLHLAGSRAAASGLPAGLGHRHAYGCDRGHAMARQLAFGSLVLASADPPEAKAQMKKLIMQGMKEVAIHEVGHTLGLRHNFKGSTLLTLKELNNPAKTGQSALAGSVMDYLPANFVPKGQKQGDYYTSTIGAYDYWAIEYAYKPIAGTPEAELPELRRIASRCAQPGLAYATDGDTRSSDPDPMSNRFDLGKDPLQYARQRVKLIEQLWPGLVDRMTAEGEGYYQVRRAFNLLLNYHGDAMELAARFIGGVYVYRDHKGDPNGRPPCVIVEARRQRDALSFLTERVFAPEAYQFPPDLYNHLAASKWSHWGVTTLDRADYPVHEIILDWQDRVLGQLLSSTKLARLLDSELKVPADQDALTAAEMLEALTAAIFAEIDDLGDGEYTNRKPAVSSLRRGLQRRYLKRMSSLAMGSTSAPDDCQTVAHAELAALEARINRVLAGKAKLDTYTRAHLKESALRIRKVLDARLELRAP